MRRQAEQAWVAKKVKLSYPDAIEPPAFHLQAILVIKFWMYSQAGGEIRQ